MPESPPTVFISYAREDLEDAQKLYDDLKRAGANPWLDRESLLPGQRWKVEIRRAIRENRYFLAVLSSNSVSRRGYVHKEVAEALEILDEFPESEIFIIPARLDDCSPSHESLRDLHWVDMFPKWEDGLKKILLAIQVIPEDETVHPDVLERPQPIEPEMVLIPAGEFLMGTREEDVDALQKKYGGEQRWWNFQTPQRKVHLPDYEIGKYPVTNFEYRAFVRDTDHKPPPHWEGDQYPEELGDHPVVNVTWQDAVAYCEWLNEKTGKSYRLPTEVEWEKAARGTDGQEFPWEDEWDASKCNTDEGGPGTTTPVGQYSPDGDSPYGVADMAGNVWEWCANWLQAYEGNRFPDEYYGEKYKVLRGGSWISYRRYARCTYRNGGYPHDRDDYWGFRVSRGSSSS